MCGLSFLPAEEKGRGGEVYVVAGTRTGYVCMCVCVCITGSISSDGVWHGPPFSFLLTMCAYVSLRPFFFLFLPIQLVRACVLLSLFLVLPGLTR